MKANKIVVLLMAFLMLVASPLIFVRTAHSQTNPIYYSVEPKAVSPLTNINASINGLETPATPSPVGQNFTVEIHLIGATAVNVPNGVAGVEIHFYFGNILNYCVPIGFTDYLGQPGGALVAPVLETYNGFYLANGTKVTKAPYTNAVYYKIAGGSTGGPWNDADGLVVTITFQIIKQPQGPNGETTAYLALANDFTDLADTLNSPLVWDAVQGTLTIDATPGGPPPSQNYSLAVNIVGSGNVTVNPSNATYVNGTIVTLTALPAVNWTFNGWSGDLTGSQNPANITMNANKTVTATFGQPPPPGQGFTLTVIVVGNGNVTVNPFNATYASGTTVTLTAVAAVNWTFDIWSGDLTGRQNPANITMNGNKTVTATFYLMGDLNHDGKVSLADLTEFARAYKSQLGDPNWNPEADLAAPYGKINLVDLVTFAYYYGNSLQH